MNGEHNAHRQFVSRGVCAERHNTLNERCARDKADISEQKKRLHALEEVSLKMSQLLEQLCRQTQSCDERLKKLEQKPEALLSRVQAVAISSLCGLILGTAFAWLFGSI